MIGRGMETRRSFFAKVAGAVAAAFSLPSLKADPEVDEQTAGCYNLVDLGEENFSRQHVWYEEEMKPVTISNARSGDLFLVEDTGEVVMVMENGGFSRGMCGTKVGSMRTRTEDDIIFIGRMNDGSVQREV